MLFSFFVLFSVSSEFIHAVSDTGFIYVSKHRELKSYPPPISTKNGWICVAKGLYLLQHQAIVRRIMDAKGTRTLTFVESEHGFRLKLGPRSCIPCVSASDDQKSHTLPKEINVICWDSITPLSKVCGQFGFLFQRVLHIVLFRTCVVIW